MKRNKGFVLTELLAAVAVLIVSFSITSVSADKINKQLKQNQALSTARDIFIETQYNLTQIKAAGKTDLLDNNDGPLTLDPKEKNLSIITSNNTNSNNFCNDEEYGGSYIIEYNKENGLVNGVWWASKDELKNFNDFFNQESYSELKNATNEKLIEWADKHGYNVGYYGNDISNVISNNDPKIIVDPPTPTPEPEPEPEPEIESDEGNGFVYYEKYSDGTYGIYTVYDFNLDKAHPSLNASAGTGGSLSQDKVVVGDGYGVFLNKYSKSTIWVDFECTNNPTYKYQAVSASATYETSLGYLYSFDKSRFDEDQTASNNNFWQRLGFWYQTKDMSDPTLVNPMPIYSNMRTAMSGIYVGKGNTNPTYSNGGYIPGPIYIRTARQLYDMSLYFAKSSTATCGLNIIQGRDIDYATYDWATYSIKTSVSPAQTPIGVKYPGGSIDCFLCNYYGNNHSIDNITFVSAKGDSGKTYFGLFSDLKDYEYSINSKSVATGIVKDLTVNCTNTSIPSVDYGGVIAGHIRKDAGLINCSSKSGKLYGKAESGSKIQ